MKLKNLISITLLSLMCCSIALSAQSEEKATTLQQDYLKGLTKASLMDLSMSEVKMDGESYPIYDMQGKRLRGTDMMQVLMTGDYTPEFYVDENKKIKAAVLRETTEEEKIQMMVMQNEMNKSPMVGKEASAFSAIDLEGKEYSLETLKGKIVVVNFWFVECKPCIMEMPELNELVEHYKDKDIVFLGFARNDSAKVQTFLKDTPFNYQIIPDSRSIAKDFGVSGYPTHVVIDQDSKISFYTTGLGPTTIKRLESSIEELLKK